MWPKVSIIWLNYNSIKIMPVVMESLESVTNLDYPEDRYELIVVDNGSTDGSFEKIKEYVERKQSLRKKIIKLDRNLGFTGGNNIGFRARDRESKYVLLLNNDAVLLQEGLKTLVEYAENNPRIAGLQGVILRYKTRFIDTAGDYIDEMLITHLLGAGHEYPWVLRKPVYITYVDGSCALYRVESVVKCLGDKLFIDEFFAYGDDNVLGLMLWNCGYKLVGIPEVVASHARGFSFGRKRGSLAHYLVERGRYAPPYITNSRYRKLIPLRALRNIATSILRGNPDGSAFTETRAFIDGVRLGKKLRGKGIFIDLYRAPIVRIPLKHLPRFFTAKQLIYDYFEKWFIRNMDFLTVEH